MTKTFRNLTGIAALTLGAAFALPASAAEHGVKVGNLTCHVSSGFGFVFGSSKDLNCTFNAGQSRIEHYTGSVSKFGVDIGYTQDGVIVWGVFAPTSDVRAGALEGDYAGASASAAGGVGVVANILVGGLDKSFSLQPISLEGMKGLNVAAGIGSITLKAAPGAPTNRPAPRP